MPTKLTRKRRDVTPVRPRKRSLRWNGGVLWPRNWRCLGELSAMLASGQGRGGRSGHGFHCAREEPLRQPDSSLTPYHPYLLRCWDAAAILLTASDTGSPPAGHSVRRSTGRFPGATRLKWPQMLWRGSLAPSTCSTSFQDHARRTPGEWGDSYGIPSRRRSDNGLIKGQEVVRDTVRGSISFMKGVGLYFFYIACVTLHPLPCLQLFIAELLPLVVHCTTSTATFVCKTFKF